jgi:tripartite-type tricarboxylate transporter receptor subunit TctC
MVNPMIDMARPYFAPPGIPAERTAVLRDAFAKLAADKAYVDEVERIAKIHPAFLPGNEMEPAIKEMLDQPPDVKKKVIGLLTTKK